MTNTEEYLTKWQLRELRILVVASSALFLLILSGSSSWKARSEIETESHRQQDDLRRGDVRKQGLRSLQQQQDGLTEFDCEISLVARDYFSQTPQHQYACTNGEDGQVFQLLPPPNSDIRPTTGDSITVKGVGIQGLGSSADTTIVVDSWYNYKPSQRRHLQEAMVGKRSAVMLFLRFTSSTSSTGFLGTSTDSSDKRKAFAKTARDTLFGNGVNISHSDAWNQCSYGKLSLNTNSDGLDPSGVGGQFVNDFPGDSADVYYADVPSVCSQSNDPKCVYDYNIASRCGSNEYYGVVFYALSQLEATIPGFSRNSYQHKVVVMDTANTGCSFVGQANVGCESKYCFSWIPVGFSQNVQVYTHELGHNLGLAHAGDATASNSLDRQYGDFSDAMGYCCMTRCYNGPHAYKLGWLLANELGAGSITGSKDYQLNSMSSTDSNSLISIKADWVGGDGNTYWIQLKTAASYDQYLPGGYNVLNKVQIKQWNKPTYGMTMDQGVKLGAGDSWVDPSGMVTVTVNKIDLSGNIGYASVNFRWTNLAGIVATPSPTFAPTPQPTPVPSPSPTLDPSRQPTPLPTSLSPTVIPTTMPTSAPSAALVVSSSSSSSSSIPAPVPTDGSSTSCNLPCKNAFGVSGFVGHRSLLGGRICRQVCLTSSNQGNRSCGKCRNS